MRAGGYFRISSVLDCVAKIYAAARGQNKSFMAPFILQHITNNQNEKPDSSRVKADFLNRFGLFLLMLSFNVGELVWNYLVPISELRILKSAMSSTGQLLTCIMSSVHSPVVITHSVQVVQIVVGKDPIRRLWLFAWRLPPRLRPGSPIHVLGALTPLDNMGRHVQAGHGKTHRVGQLVPSLANLFQQFVFRYLHCIFMQIYICRTLLLWKLRRCIQSTKASLCTF